MFKRSNWLAVALSSLAVLLTTCTPLPAPPLASRGLTATPAQAPGVGVTKEVLVMKVTPGPSPTPIACTPLPEGMTLQVEALSPTAAQVELKGLQPGEHPAVIFSTEVARQGSAKLESRDAEPIGSDGRLVDRESGLYPISASVENRWAVKIVHARGVACTEVLLPPALVGTPPEPVRLADGAALECYLLGAVGLIPEKPLLVTLHWRGEQPPAGDVVTLRLRSPDGRRWGVPTRRTSSGISRRRPSTGLSCRPAPPAASTRWKSS